MDNKDTFKITYSAQEQEEINRIRNKYVPQEPDKMQRLRALDEGVTKKASMHAIVTGILGSLIMGAGMSMAMTDFGEAFGQYRFFIGIVIGLIGIAVLAAAYPLYQRVLKKERKKIAPEILRLTNELMK